MRPARVRGCCCGTRTRDSRARLRCSVGCLTVEDPAATVDAVIARADMLMYAVKAGGKDGHRLEVLAPPPPVAER